MDACSCRLGVMNAAMPGPSACRRVEESGLQHHEQRASVELVDEGDKGGEHDEAGGRRERALKTEA
jgi:hypothetical protein